MAGDVIPGVPWRWVASPNHSGKRKRTLGVFIHSTRGRHASLEAEYQATVRYCSTVNAREVGPTAVIGPAEVTLMVHHDDICYNQTVDNDEWIGYEVAQPTATTPFTAFQYRAAADLTARSAIRYGFPVRYLGRQTTPTVQVPGILGHQDSYAGYSRGKTDPGKLWDWGRFIPMVKAKVTELSNPVEPPVESPDISPVAAAKIDAYLIAHPELGTGRSGPGLYYTDRAGDVVRKTTVGAIVFWRRLTGAVDAITWGAQPLPFDRAAVLAALTHAEADLATAKRLIG